MYFVQRKLVLAVALLAFANLSVVTAQEPSSIWAVLVAGSRGYYNYRHQADICHAYQILVRNGVPKDQIITFMYDDVAYDPSNPTPGILINHPNGSDVYQGVKIDYKGKDVTPINFLNVLMGNDAGLSGIGTGRVLKSTSKNHVFINFADHGAPGLVAFPDTELFADEFINILKQMHTAQQYSKMVIYLEACESGSMFKDLLPPHLNIFATTAANGSESSYGCYYDELRGTLLGDTYSVNWMENSDATDLATETLQKQYLVVKAETNESHVQEYGDKSLRNLPVAEFLGNSPSRTDRPAYPTEKKDQIESREVVKEILKRQLASATAKNDTEAVGLYTSSLRRLNKLRKLVRSEMLAILREVTKNDRKEMETLLTSRFSLTNWDCYKRVTKAFSKECFSIAKNSYVSGRLFILVNLCERGWEAERILSALSHTCQHSYMTEIH